MKQLDVDVSPPAFVWNPYLTLTQMTFDLGPRDLYEFFIVTFFLVFVTDIQTD